MQQIQLLDMPRQEFVANLPRPEPPKDYRLPDRYPDIRGSKRITLDIESYDPDIEDKGPGWKRNAHIIGVGINADNRFKEYFPVAHTYGSNCDRRKVFQWLRDNLNGFRGEITGANLLYDGEGLQKDGIHLCGNVHDIQWAEPLLDEDSFSYGLDALARKYLGITKQEAEIEVLYGPKWKNAMREVHPGHIKNYVFGDINMPGAILDKQMVELESQDLLRVYDLESRLFPMLLYMKDLGVPIDLNRTRDLQKEFQDRIHVMEGQMELEVGFPVNFRPSKSLFTAFDSLGIKYPSTEKGNPSATNQWLETVDHPFAEMVCAIREYDKILGTFIENAILGNSINGRIHCEFHPLKRMDEQGSRGTVSGRFSSTNPNLQQIPVRTELGRLIREAFIPRVGWKWWSRDYSQIEYRLLVHLAMLAKCPGAEIAAKMYRDNPETDFHIMVSELTGLERKPAKNLNFGLVYGMGKKKLARTLKVSDEKAAEIMGIYHDRAPFIKNIFEKAMQTAQERGYVKTLMGRRARFNKVEENPFTGQPQRAKTHKALNRVLQGSAADLMKLAMVNLWDSGILNEGVLEVYLTEHDELDGGFEPSEKGLKMVKEVTRIMENAMQLEVPILTAGGEGKNWAEAH